MAVRRRNALGKWLKNFAKRAVGLVSDDLDACAEALLPALYPTSAVACDGEDDGGASSAAGDDGFHLARVLSRHANQRAVSQCRKDARSMRAASPTGSRTLDASIFALWAEVLLGEAIDKASPLRKECVGSIMGLSDTMQRTLMAVTEEQLRVRASEDPERAEGEAAGGGVDRAAAAETPLEAAAGATAAGAAAAGAVAAGPEERERLERLEAEVAALRRSLARSEEDKAALAREAEKFKAQLTSASLEHSLLAAQDAEKANARWQRLVDDLEAKLGAAEARAGDSDAMRKQAQLLEDELEVLRPLPAKMESLQAALGRSRKALEEAGDLRSALQRETEARESESARALKAEREAAKVPGLQQALAEARGRAADAELELRTLRKRASAAADKVAEGEARLFALEKRQLQESHGTQASTEARDMEEEDAARAFGMGVSELNPQIATRLERLQQENRRLEERLALCDEGAALSLRNDTEAAKALADAFEAKLTATEDALKDARYEAEKLTAALKDATFRLEQEAAAKAALRRRLEEHLQMAQCDKEAATQRLLLAQEASSRRQHAAGVARGAAEHRRRAELRRTISRGTEAYRKLRAQCKVLSGELDEVERSLETAEEQKGALAASMKRVEEAAKRKIVELTAKLEVTTAELGAAKKERTKFQRQAVWAQTDAERARREARAAAAASGGELDACHAALRAEMESLMEENKALRRRASRAAGSSPAAAGAGGSPETAGKERGGPAAGGTGAQAGGIRGGARRVALQPSAASPMYREALAQFEAELDREKTARREAVLKLNAAIADKRKAEQAVWALQAAAQREAEERNSLKLRCERAERRARKGEAPLTPGAEEPGPSPKPATPQAAAATPSRDAQGATKAAAQHPPADDKENAPENARQVLEGLADGAAAPNGEMRPECTQS